jgi:hypothetical protein
MYPGPHHDLLKAHYQTSIFASLVAGVEPLDDDDEEEEEKELPEIPSQPVQIWADDTNRYPLGDRKLDNEEQDNSSPGVLKDVEVQPPSQSCAAV